MVPAGSGDHRSRAGTVPRYGTVVLDVDSTLSGIEGIEWLAGRRGDVVRRRVRAATEAAMRGDTPLDAVYGERLELVRPGRQEMAALASAYLDAVAPGARAAVRLLRARGVRIVMVSGGIRQALGPLAAYLGIPSSDVHAVPLRFGPDGEYAGYDVESPLWRGGGKAAVVESLRSQGDVLAMGDGMTDAELRGVVARFVAFTGFVHHDSVVALADAAIAHFRELPPLVLS